MTRVPIAAAVAALALLTFFQFPGHTWLQQDSQIYAPILEHLDDRNTLRNDVLVQRPHVSFTLYDEAALWLHRVTGLGFRDVLAGEQIVTRALGIWGVYLMAGAAGLAAGPALLVAAIVSLGAMIAGPQVLTLEYEPVPRGFAVPLLVCAVGLASHGRYIGAGAAGAIAFLIHPPSAYPFWGLYFLLALRPSQPEVMKQRIYGLLCLLLGAVALMVAAQYQAGAGESQVFFSTLTPLQVQLQHWRAAYLWVSLWGPDAAPHYLVACVLLAAALWRIRGRMPGTLRFFAVGLPLVGLLSLPASYLLLERIGWALLPQFQPLRALLFVVLMLQFAAAVAAVSAATERRFVEAFAWFAAAYAAPLLPRFDAVPEWHRAAALLLLAGAAAGSLWLAQRKGAWAAAPLVAALAAFWVAPDLGRVVNYPRLHTAELAQLSGWAKQATPRDAVFLFADTPRSMDTGIFRAGALRAVYVDWKGGGQVNYLKELGEQWWFRWQQTLGSGFHPGDLPKYDALGIQYVVLQPRNRLPDRAPLFENAKYLAYDTRPAAARYVSAYRGVYPTSSVFPIGGGRGSSAAGAVVDAGGICRTLGAIVTARAASARRPCRRDRRHGGDRSDGARWQQEGEDRGEQNRQDGRGVAAGADRRTIRGDAQSRDRARLHRSLLESPRQRRLPLRVLRQRVVPLGRKVRVGHGMAQFLGARRGGECRVGAGYLDVHGARGSAVPQVRRAPRPHLRRRSRAHRIALLHQFGGAEVRGGMSMAWTRREFIGSSLAAVAAPRRPNVLVFMSDQESALLPGPVELPNRRKLERGAMRFTHAFCNTPQCSAARSVLLTGLPPHRTGVLTNVDGSSLGKPLDPSLTTIGKVFRDAGYSTGYFGKWHLGGTGKSLSPFGFDHSGGEHGGEKGDDLVASDAAAWIGTQKGPWFAWVSVLNPHHIYSLEDVPVRPGVRPPASDLRDLAGKPREQMEYVEKDQGKQTRDYKPADWQRYRSFYCSLVEKVDANLGTVLGAVGGLDNTVVAYTSDHGDALGEHGLPFKGPFMYEEEIRIPLLLRAPWALAGGESSELVTQADLAPRVAALAGVKWPGPPPARDRDAVLLEYYAKQKWVNPIRTIRTREWKLNWYDRGNRELYHLSEDPHELRNLAGKGETVEAKLAQRLTEWRPPMLST